MLFRFIREPIKTDANISPVPWYEAGSFFLLTTHISSLKFRFSALIFFLAFFTKTEIVSLSCSAPFKTIIAFVMNGRIGATSTRNKGSTFYIDLPRIRNAQATAIIEEENRRAADIAEQLRVIKEQSEVIDDNNDNNNSDTQDAEFTDTEININSLEN